MKILTREKLMAFAQAQNKLMDEYGADYLDVLDTLWSRAIARNELTEAQRLRRTTEQWRLLEAMYDSIRFEGEDK